MDLEGNIQLWNEGARRLYGYEPEDAIGKENSSVLRAGADVGVGLPLRMMACLRAVVYDQARGQGTGLGLATIYGIVAQARGQVSLYAEPGRGTRAWVLLPITNQTEAPELPAVSPKAGQ